MATLKSLVDETTNIKNELKTCHSNLSSALTEKGVEVSSEDKMSSLIDKVGGLGFGVNIQRGFVNFPKNTTKTTVTISKVDKTKSVCLGRSKTVGTYTGYTEAICKLESNTQISLNKGLSYSYEDPFYWEVIEFSGANKVYNISLNSLKNNTMTIKTHTHNLNLANPNKCLVYWTCNTTAQGITPEAVEVFNLTSNTIDVGYEGSYIDNLYISIVEFE